jgi:hypothetical protein
MAVIEQVLVQVAIKRREFFVGCHPVSSFPGTLRCRRVVYNDSMTVETNDGFSIKSVPEIAPHRGAAPDGARDPA